MPPRHHPLVMTAVFLPFYAGPLLAGWSRAPVLVAAILAGLFTLAQFAGGKLARPVPGLSMAAHAILLVLVQVVLVALLYAAGGGLAALFGGLALPLWLPLALTAAGSAFSVLLYRRDGELDEVLDNAIRTIESGSGSFDFAAEPSETDPELQAAARAERMAVERLRALPDTAGIGMIDPIVRELADAAGARAYGALLADAAEGSRGIDLGFLRYMALPGIRRELENQEALGFALSVLLDSEDEAVMAELASLTWTLLDDKAPAHDLPPLEGLTERAARFPVLAPLVEPVAAAQDGQDRG